MLKFFRHKGTEIRKAALVDEAGNKKVVAIIGQVEELLEIGLLEPSPGMNERAWVAIPAPGVSSKEKEINETFVELNLVEHDTLEESKEFVMEWFK